MKSIEFPVNSVFFIITIGPRKTTSETCLVDEEFGWIIRWKSVDGGEPSLKLPLYPVNH